MLCVLEELKEKLIKFKKNILRLKKDNLNLSTTEHLDMTHQLHMKTTKCYLCNKRHLIVKRNNAKYMDCPKKGLVIIKK